MSDYLITLTDELFDICKEFDHFGFLDEFADDDEAWLYLEDAIMSDPEAVIEYLSRVEEDDTDLGNRAHYLRIELEQNILETAIEKRFEKKQIECVAIHNFPDSDEINFIEIERMKSDASQGTGNLIYRYFYIPALDILCCFADY